MAAEGLPLPRLYRALGEITLNRRLVELLRQMEPEPIQVATSEDILELVQEAAFLGLKLESGEGAGILGRILKQLLADLAADFQMANVARLAPVSRSGGPHAHHPGPGRSAEFHVQPDEGAISRRWRPGQPKTPRPKPWPGS